jgi:hypothetical protein
MSSVWVVLAGGISRLQSLTALVDSPPLFAKHFLRIVQVVIHG